MSKSIKMDVNPNVIQPTEFKVFVSLPDTNCDGLVTVELFQNDKPLFTKKLNYLAGVSIDTYVQTAFQLYSMRCTSNSSVSLQKD